MALIKCPRCELNYMNDTDEMCSVCRREVRGESEQYEMIELCSECGENPVVPGHELCASCLKARSRRSEFNSDEDMERTANIGIDSVATMEEIEIDSDDTFSEDADFRDDDDDDDDKDEDDLDEEE